MRILVTNDDGIETPGLHVLARALTRLGEVLVVAPDGEYSGSSAAFGAINLIRPVVLNVAVDGIDESFSVSGPPALCVLFGCLGAFGPPPDLVVAGINPGANVGRSIYHSGTVGAAITARSRGISGLAVSQDLPEADGDAQLWDTAAQVAVEVARGLLLGVGGTAVALNLNVPNRSLADLKGWCSAEVGTVAHRALARARLEPRAEPAGGFDVVMEFGEPNVLPPQIDGGAVSNGYVSVTWLSPIRHEFDPSQRGSAAVVEALSALVGNPVHAS